ncbi:MAG: NTP transferase domain-containing protein [Bacilli bacterium]|nr:NTP transferase domain-containing protein [Bacilli bacterium]
MENRNLYVVILGAGRGSRMESRDPNHSKVAYPILGKPLINYVIDAVKPLGLKDLFTVVGYGGKATEECVKNYSKVVWQHQILGTGHALKQVTELKDKEGDVIVVGGEMALLTTETLKRLYHKHVKDNNDLTICTSVLENPRGYGHVIREKGSYRLLEIKEDKDANEEEREITEVNAGIYIINNKLLQNYLPKLSNNNSKKEYYLSELVSLFNKDGYKSEAYVLEDAQDIFSVSDRFQLAYAAKVIRKRTNLKLMLSGVSIEDPDTAYISPDIKIGKDTVICPNTTILGNSEIGEINFIGPNATLINAKIGSDNKIVCSYLKDVKIGDHKVIGPYCNMEDEELC